MHKGYEEVHVPALKPKPFADGAFALGMHESSQLQLQQQRAPAARLPSPHCCGSVSHCSCS